MEEQTMMHHELHMHHHHDGNMMMDMMGEATDEFCQGGEMGMAMYMDGFHWTLKTKTTCLNFLLPQWTLNTKGRFFLAMAFVVFLGILTEGLQAYKHKLGQPITTKQKLVSAGLRGSSLILAYFLMLVVMTYSLELFSCVVLGLMIGYYWFDGDTFPQTDGHTPCCNFGGVREGPEELTEALIPNHNDSGCCDQESNQPL